MRSHISSLISERERDCRKYYAISRIVFPGISLWSFNKDVSDETKSIQKTNSIQNSIKKKSKYKTKRIAIHSKVWNTFNIWSITYIISLVEYVFIVWTCLYITILFCVYYELVLQTQIGNVKYLCSWFFVFFLWAEWHFIPHFCWVTLHATLNLQERFVKFCFH